MKQYLLTLIMAAISMPGYACSMAFWNNNDQAKVVARSTDLYVSDDPKIIVSPRGMNRSGNGGENSLEWKSKYGTVVVNAFNSDTISDGMNEEGLVAHLLYLHDTQYPKRVAQKPALANLAWAQYVLDNFKTVDEVVKNTESLQIVSAKVHDREWPLHLAVQDPSGDSAIIEYIKGELKIHHGKQYTVMTNEPPYNVQMENLKRYKLFGGKLAMPGDIDSMSRFVRASSYLKTLPAPQNYIQAIAGILSVIKTTMVPFGAEDTSGIISTDTWPTRWISMADLSNKIYYFSSTTTPNIIWLDFKHLNFSENADTLMVDPNDLSLIGEVSKNLKKK